MSSGRRSLSTSTSSLGCSADTRWYGRGMGSDVPIGLRAVDAYEVSDGQIVRAVLGYADVATALQDLGLTP